MFFSGLRQALLLGVLWWEAGIFLLDYSCIVGRL